MSISSNIRVGSLIGADLRVGNVAPLAAYYGDELVFSFNPASLFTSGEQGAWYDPSDLSTMFTDTAGTTPATVGDSVARINDKSGRGNHATQATVEARPILRQTAGGLHYLHFDGVDDFLVTPTITPGTDKAQVFAGARKLTDSSYRWLCALRSPRNTNGTFAISASLMVEEGEADNRRNWALEARGTVRAIRATVNSFTAPASAVLTAQFDNDGSDNVGELRVNGQPEPLAPASVDSGDAINFANAVLDIGGDTVNSNYMRGDIYSLVVRFGPNLSASKIDGVEKWMSRETGIEL